MDIQIEDHGTIVLVRPLTPVGKEWLETHTESEPWQWIGPALSVAWRYADDLIEGMIADGLVVAR
jgi:hypothetical protein